MHTTIAMLVVLSATPRVESVVLYPDRAQVTRVAEIACGSRATVRFEGIPPAADPASLRANGVNATIEGLRTETRTRDVAFSKERAEVDEALRKLDAEVRALDDQVELAKNTGELGDLYENVAIAMINREMTARGADPKAWSSAFDTALKARLDAVAQSSATVTRRRELTYRYEELHRRKALLEEGANRRELIAEVLASCAQGSGRIELTYLVGGASWSPAYEARAEEPGNVELSTYATVVQHTGEDWKGARILLSTAVPSQDATPPEIQPLKVYAEERNEKKVLVRREEQIQHAQTGAAAGPASGGMAARAQGLSVQLEVQRPSDVPGDGSPMRLFVGKHRLPATFAWRSVPTLAPFTFRVADVTNAAPFPLLAGPLDVFGRNGFVGRYPMDRVAEGAPFHVTFGVEENVKVKRTVLEEVKRDQGLFNQKKRFRYAYRFELKNHADRALDVELADRIPVSELEDVEVRVDEKTTRGFHHQVQDGVLTWKLKLAPAETKVVDLHFFVDVPGSYDMGGL